MRPSLPLILIVLALLVSVIVGLMLGGGPLVWFGERTGASGTNENVDLPLAPNTPNAPTPIVSSTATRVATPTINPTVPPSTTERPPTVPTAVAEPVESEAVPSETPPSEITESEATDSETTEVTEVRVTVVSIALRLRAIPGTDGEIVATLQNGVQGVAIQRDSQGWLEVEVNDPEVTGWLFGGSDFVTIEGDVETLPLLES